MKPKVRILERVGCYWTLQFPGEILSRTGNPGDMADQYTAYYGIDDTPYDGVEECEHGFPIMGTCDECGDAFLCLQYALQGLDDGRSPKQVRESLRTMGFPPAYTDEIVDEVVACPWSHTME